MLQSGKEGDKHSFITFSEPIGGVFFLYLGRQHRTIVCCFPPSCLGWLFSSNFGYAILLNIGHIHPLLFFFIIPSKNHKDELHRTQSSFRYPKYISQHVYTRPVKPRQVWGDPYAQTNVMGTTWSLYLFKGLERPTRWNQQDISARANRRDSHN